MAAVISRGPNATTTKARGRDEARVKPGLRPRGNRLIGHAHGDNAIDELTVVWRGPRRHIAWLPDEQNEYH